MVMAVVMMMILPASKYLASLLVEIALLLDARQLDLQPLELVLQVTIRRLEVVALLQPLATAVLRVAAVLQGPSLLLQAHHLRTTRASVLRAIRREQQGDRFASDSKLFCLRDLYFANSLRYLYLPTIVQERCRSGRCRETLRASL